MSATQINSPIDLPEEYISNNEQNIDNINLNDEKSSSFSKDILIKKLTENKIKIVENPKINKTRSDIWQRFGMLSLLDEYSNTKKDLLIKGFVVCKMCKAIYTYTSGTTTTLQHHMKTCKLQTSSNQLTIQKIFPNRKIHESLKTNIIKAASLYVIKDLRPFTAIEGSGFEMLANELILTGVKYGNVQAKDILPRAQTISNHIKDEEALAREKLQKLLRPVIDSLSPAISYTTDIWTDRYMAKSWLGLTLHWINNEWDMKSVSLECIHF